MEKSRIAILPVRRYTVVGLGKNAICMLCACHTALGQIGLR